MFFTHIKTNITYSALLRQADVIAAIELRLLSGEEAQTVQEPCVMLVAYVRLISFLTSRNTNLCTDYAKLTRKMGGKAMTSSNLRPKSLDHGSPSA